MPLVIFRKYETKHSLLKLLRTRFTSYFIMIDRLLEVKITIKQSVVDPQWVVYVNMLNDDNKDKSRTMSRVVYNIVVVEYSWNHCTNVRELIASVVYVLHDFYAKTPYMGKVLYIIQNLEKHVLGL